MNDSEYQKWLKQVTPLKKRVTHPEFARRTSQPHHTVSRRHIREHTIYHERKILCHNFDHIPPRLFHAMQYERIHISNIIDLHGLYVHHAEQKIKDQIHLRTNRQLTFWRIIHGKGRHSPHYDRAPVKHQILNLLINHSAVAALASIPDIDGDSGSVIIALHPSVN